MGFWRPAWFGCDDAEQPRTVVSSAALVVRNGGRQRRADELSISAAAADRPEAVFLVGEDQRLTFADVATRVARLAQHLSLTQLLDQDDDSERDDTVAVAIDGQRSLPQLVLLCALLEHRVPFVVLHPRWVTAERDEVLARCRPRVVLSERDVARAFALSETTGPPYQEQRAASADLVRSSAQVVLFTSGTSGRPKGVRLSRRALCAAAESSSKRLDGSSADRWLLNLPLAHVGGLSILTRTLSSRSRLIVAAEGSFDPVPFGATIERCGATHVSVVPTMLQRIVGAKLQSPRSLRAVLVGGARAPMPLLEAGRALGWPLVATYGLTEASSQVATQRPHRPLTSAFLPPMPGMEVRINPAGKASSQPEAADPSRNSPDAGRIEIRGPALFSGYLGESQQGVDDWFSTGDWGVLHADGLEVLDRCDDVLITGGENVAPAAVEQVLERHPEVEQACVFGLPDTDWGQRIVAVVKRFDGLECPPLDYDDVLREGLAAFKRPRQTVWVSALPQTVGGKLDRVACRELFGSLQEAGGGSG